MLSVKFGPVLETFSWRETCGELRLAACKEFGLNETLYGFSGVPDTDRPNVNHTYVLELVSSFYMEGDEKKTVILRMQHDASAAVINVALKPFNAVFDYQMHVCKKCENLHVSLYPVNPLGCAEPAEDRHRLISLKKQIIAALENSESLVLNAVYGMALNKKYKSGMSDHVRKCDIAAFVGSCQSVETLEDILELLK